MRLLVLTIAVMTAAGCSSEVPRKGTPVSVTGNVSQGGRPVGGVTIVFQPLGDGHTKELPTQKDGSFQGDFVSGEYAYYISKLATPAAQQSPSKIPPQYFAADLSRTVVIESGKTLAIALY